MGRGEAPVLYAVHVRKEAIVGFRYPLSKEEPGEGENIVRSGEARVASHLMAVLGMPSPLQRTWDNLESAQYVADAIAGAKVVLIEASKKGSEERSKAMSKKEKKPIKPEKGAPRKCGKCGKRGHTARSHAPGGRLA